MGNIPYVKIHSVPLGSNAKVDTDPALAANSDTLVPSQKAVKTYVDNSKICVTVGFDSACDYICDGTADDVQIQEAIDYIDSLGGGTLFIKRGTYNCASHLDFCDNLIFKGEGKITQIKQNTPGSGDFLRLKDVYDVTIDDIYINGNTAKDVDGIFANLGIGWAIQMSTTNLNTTNKHNITIKNSWIYGGDRGCIATWNTNYVTIKNCHITHGLDCGIAAVLGSTNLNFEGNFIDDCWFCISVSSTGVTQEQFDIVGLNKDVCITNNFISSTCHYGYGIQTDGTERISITDNRVVIDGEGISGIKANTNLGAEVDITDVKDCIISENTVRWNGTITAVGSGISTSRCSESITISNNTVGADSPISSPTLYGIYVEGVDANVSDNSVKNLYYGMIIDSENAVRNYIVKGNRFSGNRRNVRFSGDHANKSEVFLSDNISEDGVEVNWDKYTGYIYRSSDTSITVGFDGSCDYICDGTADDVQIAQAITYLDSVGGGSLLLKKGEYDIAAIINLCDNLVIYGEGDSTKLVHNFTGGKIFRTTGTSNVEIHSLFFYGHAPLPAAIVEGAIGGTGDYIYIHNNKFDNFYGAHAVGMANGTNIRICDNIVGDCSGFGSEGGIDTLLIKNNIFFRGTTDYAITCNGNSARNNNVVIDGNWIMFGAFDYDEIPSGGGIDVTASNVVITNNRIDNAYRNGILVHGNQNWGGTENCENVVISGNHLGENIGVFGITVEGTGTDFPANASLKVIIENNYFGKPLALSGTSDIIIKANFFDGGGIYSEYNSDIVIDGNTFKDSNPYVFGIVPSSTFADKVTFTNNKIINPTTIFLSGNRPTNSVIRNNVGYVTENSGTATIPSGSTSIVVTHGLSATPTADDISITPTNGMGNAVKFWVTNLTSTQFTINVDVDPSTDQAQFSWQAIIL